METFLERRKRREAEKRVQRGLERVAARRPEVVIVEDDPNGRPIRVRVVGRSVLIAGRSCNVGDVVDVNQFDLAYLAGRGLVEEIRGFW